MLAIHHALQSLGRTMGGLVRLGMMAVLYLGSVALAVSAALAAGFGLDHLTGWGVPARVAGFLSAAAFIGAYVVPHVGPQLGGAAAALAKEVPLDRL